MKRYETEEEYQERQRHSALTEPEIKVVRLIAACKSPKEIAAELGFTKGTVKVLGTRSLKKLGFTNRGEIIRWLTPVLGRGGQ